MIACTRTDTGVMRRVNEDFAYCSTLPVGKLPNLLVVADGMGGHQAGDFASQYAVETFVEAVASGSSAVPFGVIRDAVVRANSQVLKRSLEDMALRGMGTTLVAATVIEDILYVANIGDSRLYVINEGIRQITRDHSYVEEAVARGEIKRGSPEYESQKKFITRVIGVDSKAVPDFFEVEVQPGDILLLCTDGLTNMVSDEQIRRIVNGPLELEEKAQALVDAANQNGGRDNITVILASAGI
ncbi:Stp1/IreP family PP2C-type Ser/Thr phosphatase [Cuneatibacter caecimuris]|uniref:Protein phosphatase n=1 Tax=Cuneatibacter caecimuris TaxID=1796618 RepID=A0A4Q7PS91_9FIRM|nr:Stp1/IreP family PP2C-type Ser/Thr phosphatase [Cuneatibacter caecimuris]RZT02150.1 protein phosphatase [Cuneatibacter caecimuris]